MILQSKELKGLMLNYLSVGYRQEIYEIISMEIDEQRVTASVDLNNLVLHSDGQYHLSSTLALPLLQQIATVYTCIDNGLTSPPGGLMLLDMSLKFRKAIREQRNVLFLMDFKNSRIARKGSGIVLYKDVKISINDYSFHGCGSFMLTESRVHIQSRDN